ncbi:MAG: neutral zinc metallopeptidase [Chloroflexia bacterium]|nr:neutral zinc metallopeptidase [Chloroflexia bacterium]
MSRRFGLVLAIAIALVTAMSASAQSPADVVLADLDEFWAEQFAAAGHAYWPPGVVLLGEPVATSCGTLSSSFGPGAYCGADSTLYYTPVWFFSFESDGFDHALLTVLAHEWGHHLQLLIGIPWSAAKGYELQADCLAGVYARHAEQQGLAPVGALAESIRLSAISGDVGPLPHDAAEHGTGAERAISFFNGYEAGVIGCGITL